MAVRVRALRKGKAASKPRVATPPRAVGESLAAQPPGKPGRHGAAMHAKDRTAQRARPVQAVGPLHRKPVRAPGPRAAAKPPTHHFTVQDTPRIRSRIQGDLDKAIDCVRQGDPRLRALVLTGGFARGEGAVRAGEPQNDYDLVAVRGIGPSRSYVAMRKELEERLGIHIDLAPVAAARLPWAPRSIFWYETAQSGRVLWGDPTILDRVPARRPLDIDRREAMRLLVNRAAGLVFATQQDDDGRRLQASKALLGAMDAWMLAQGVFPPTQTLRWKAFQNMAGQDAVPDRLAANHDWLAWAIAYKTRPDDAPHRGGQSAWHAAARAVLDAVPEALDHAGIASLAAYGRQDSLIDHVQYLRHVVKGGRPVRHPTSRVRVATLRMLASCLEDGHPGPWLSDIAGRAGRHQPLLTLEAMRAATLQ